MFTRYRLLLALKAAIGVAVAWLLGLLLPGELDTFAYYAPLGALLGVAPTVIGSIRTSAEMVIGIALGVGIGWLLISTGMPWFLRVPLAALLGVIVAGFPKLGEGRAYVSIASVFVVILGRDDPESYGMGYVVQFGLGVVIGILINMIFVPPLSFQSAHARVSSLRLDIANHLDELADVLDAHWPPDRQDWLHYARRLRQSLDDAQRLVDEARDSGKANPRTLWHHADVSTDYDDLAALRQIGLRLSDITEALSGAIWNDPVAVELPPEMRAPMRASFQSIAEYMRAWDSGDGLDAAREKCRAAGDEINGTLHRENIIESGAGTIVFALRTIRTRIDERTEETAS